MAISHIVIELRWFFFPLKKAVSGGENLSEFFALFGYDLSEANAGNALNDLNNLSQLVSAISDTIDAAIAAAGNDTFDLTDSEKAAIISAGTQVYEAVDGIGEVVRSIMGDIPPNDFPLEIFDRLVDLYLSNRTPVIREILTVLDARKSRNVLETDANGRSLDYTEVRYDFSRIGQFINDTGEWADEVYGWGREFDHLKAILALGNLVESFGGRVRLDKVDDSVLAAFLQNAPQVTLPDGTTTTANVTQALLPIYSAKVGMAEGEAGVTLLPFGDFNRLDQMGLALAPYIEGAVNGEISLSDRLTFEFEATAGATGGRSITFQPSGLGSTGAGAVDAEFTATLTYSNADDAPIVLIGDAEGTRVQVDKLLASTGGSLDGDMFIAAGARGLQAIIDPGDDGLLSALIPEPIVVTVDDLLVGIRPGRGVYFEGGTALEVDIPLDIDLDLLKIMGLGLRLDWSDGFAIDTTLEGELKIGPLYAYADGIGVRTEIVQRPGLLGDYDLDFGFIPPSTYAVSLDISPIEGGGLISIRDKEYRGALALKFESIGFSAFGILNTELPGGQEGFSFAATIFGEFSLALGYGFFLTGLGGMIGINRTIDTTAMRDVLYEGRLDNILFPNNPIENAATILDDMAAILPPRTGQHVVGPVARISWGVPSLVNLTLGVIIEVGDEARIIILGGLGCDLPTPDTAIISLHLSFFGEIDFSARTISFDATLQNSRVLTFTLSGDVALRTGWAPRIEHIVSFGGLHPNFPRPSNLPDLRRMSIAFGTNNPRVTLSGYAAVTLNSLQFGAELDVYAKGPKIWLVGQLAAEGWAYFHALVIYDPFAFSANLGGGINLLRNGNTVCGLGFDITLTGPNRFTIDGKVWVTVLGIDVDFKIKHSWGSAQSLPSARTDAVALLREAVAAAQIEPSNAHVSASAVRLRDFGEDELLIAPLGGAQISQNRVPLDIRLDKIGEALITGPRTLGLRLKRDGQVVSVGALTADFVHGQFFETTKTEKLRATAYDHLKSGAILGQAELDSDGTSAIRAVYDYEIIRIPVIDTRQHVTRGAGMLRAATTLVARHVMARRMEGLQGAVEFHRFIEPIDKVVADPERFIPPAALGEALAQPAGRTGPIEHIDEGQIYGSFAGANESVRAGAEATFAASGHAAMAANQREAAPIPEYFAAAMR